MLAIATYSPIEATKFFYINEKPFCWNNNHRPNTQTKKMSKSRKKLSAPYELKLENNNLSFTEEPFFAIPSKIEFLIL